MIVITPELCAHKNRNEGKILIEWIHNYKLQLKSFGILFSFIFDIDRMDWIDDVSSKYNYNRTSSRTC